MVPHVCPFSYLRRQSRVRKAGQIIRRGPQMWMVRIYVGRDPETRKRNYIGKSIIGGLPSASAGAAPIRVYRFSLWGFRAELWPLIRHQPAGALDSRVAAPGSGRCAGSVEKTRRQFRWRRVHGAGKYWCGTHHGISPKPSRLVLRSLVDPVVPPPAIDAANWL